MRVQWFRGLATASALAAFMSVPLAAQAPAGRGAAPSPPAAPTPRGPDGKVVLGAGPSGKGFWNNGLGSLLKTGNRALPTNLALADVPFRPWAKALYEFRQLRGGLAECTTTNASALPASRER